MSLLGSFMERHRDIEQRVAGFAANYSGLDPMHGRLMDIGAPAGALLARALGLKDRNFTSWLPGIPLAATLVPARRVTVDIAPHFLESFRWSFGISEDALVDFARAKMLVVNIRDFDPGAAADSRDVDAAKYEPYARIIHRLFEECPDSIYFLSTLRPRIFDAIPDFGSKAPAEKPTLRAIFEIAQRDLGPAAEASVQLPGHLASARRSIFRAEVTHPRATFWHWAYVMSVARFVDPDLLRELNFKFDVLAEGAPEGDPEAQIRLGSAFIDFQTTLRFAHLVYSAPLSAAFGGPYGYGLEDDHIFMQAVEREMRWSEETAFEYDYFEDDLLDLVQDLQIGRLRPRFSALLSGKNYEVLRALGTDLYVRTEPTSYFNHYDDERNRAGLKNFWMERSANGPSSYAEMDRTANALLEREGDLHVEDLFDPAHARAEERETANALLRRWTQGFQIVTQPTANARRTAAEVCTTNPREANLLVRVLVALGLKRKNAHAAVGRGGDYPRIAFSASRDFRSNPS